MPSYETRDSGKRERFSSGAKRDTRTGKGRYDLLPVLALFRVAGVYERGAVKYAARNWEKGMPFSRFLDSGLRHVNAYIAGDRSEDHLAQAVFNFLAILHFEELIKAGLVPATLDDLPTWSKALGKLSKSKTANLCCGPLFGSQPPSSPMERPKGSRNRQANRKARTPSPRTTRSNRPT